jgi:hypothetical protein
MLDRRSGNAPEVDHIMSSGSVLASLHIASHDAATVAKFFAGDWELVGFV